MLGIWEQFVDELIILLASRVIPPGLADCGDLRQQDQDGAELKGRKTIMQHRECRSRAGNIHPRQECDLYRHLH